MKTERCRLRLVALGIGLALSSVVGVTNANPLLTQQTNSNAFELQTATINTGVAVIENVRAALLSSYSNNNNWPASTMALVATGYIGTINAEWGQAVTGAPVGGGNSYALNLSAPNEYVARGIAARLGGSVSGNVVALTVPVPASASIAASGLSRVAVPGDPTRNQMQTDIDLNHYNLNNVQVLNGNSVNVNDLQVSHHLVSNSGAFSQGLTVGTNLTVGDTLTTRTLQSDDVLASTATFGGLTVNGGAAVNGVLKVNALQSASTITGSELMATVKVTTPLLTATTVDAREVLADSAVIKGNVKADSGTYNTLGVSTLTAQSGLINGGLKVVGTSDFTGDAVFRNSVLINGGLNVVSVATIGEIKEGGQFLRDRYLGINATAKNADMLANVAASQYARRDTVNTFTQAQTFNSTATVKGRLNADGEVYSNGKRVIGSDGKLYYQGQDLDSRYLGINATAKNAEKLGNVDASQYARRDTVNTFTQAQTFNNTATVKGRLNADGEIYSNGKRAVGSDGKLYYQGQDVDGRYLGIDAKAKNAEKADYASLSGTADYATNAASLGGISSSQFARKDIANVFNGNQSFNANLAVLGASTLNALVTNGQATFNGTSTFNGLVAMRKGLTVSGGAVQVDGAYDVKVGNISLKDLSARVKNLEENQDTGGGAPVNYVWKTVYNNSAGTTSFQIPTQYLSTLKMVSAIVDGTLISGGSSWSDTKTVSYEYEHYYCGKDMWSQPVNVGVLSNGRVYSEVITVRYTKNVRRSGDCQTETATATAKRNITKVNIFVPE
ncbi:hypothetical protein AB9X29_003770 [Vibrio vulnificus]